MISTNFEVLYTVLIKFNQPQLVVSISILLNQRFLEHESDIHLNRANYICHSIDICSTRKIYFKNMTAFWHDLQHISAGNRFIQKFKVKTLFNCEYVSNASLFTSTLFVSYQIQESHVFQKMLIFYALEKIQIRTSICGIENVCVLTRKMDKSSSCGKHP